MGVNRWGEKGGQFRKNCICSFASLRNETLSSEQSEMKITCFLSMVQQSAKGLDVGGPVPVGEAQAEGAGVSALHSLGPGVWPGAAGSFKLYIPLYLGKPPPPLILSMKHSSLCLCVSVKRRQGSLE